MIRSILVNMLLNQSVDIVAMPAADIPEDAPVDPETHSVFDMLGIHFV